MMSTRSAIMFAKTLFPNKVTLKVPRLTVRTDLYPQEKRGLRNRVEGGTLTARPRAGAARGGAGWGCALPQPVSQQPAVSQGLCLYLAGLRLAVSIQFVSVRPGICFLSLSPCPDSSWFRFRSSGLGLSDFSASLPGSVRHPRAVCQADS